LPRTISALSELGGEGRAVTDVSFKIKPGQM
jgi:hypothetical protein